MLPTTRLGAYIFRKIFFHHASAVAVSTIGAVERALASVLANSCLPVQGWVAGLRVWG